MNVFRFLRKKEPKHVVELADQLMESQYWTLDKLKEMQWDKLKPLIEHAYQNVPFYKLKFDELKLDPNKDIRSLDCLNKLPVLTKTDIQTHGQDLCSTISGDDLFENATGGSTGQPINFYQDQNYKDWADAARIRAWRRIEGVDDDAVEAVFWGAIRDIGQGLSWKSVLKSVIRYRTLQLNTFDLNEDLLRRFLKIYNFVKPQIVRGYASSLYFISNFVQREKLKIHLPRVILSSAELLHPNMRSRICEVFGSNLIDSYGCREVSQIATECSSHNGLHVVMENQIVELVDKEIIVTNLNNLGMPFLRYKVGDMATSIDSQPCSCGRCSVRLTELVGRQNDNIELPNGKVINGEFFEFLFFGMKTVEKFQVIYSRNQNELRARVQVTDDSEKVDQMIENRMSDLFDFQNVRVEFTSDFQVPQSGKFRFVYSVDDFEDC